MANELKIQISADVQGAVAGVNALAARTDILQQRLIRLQQIASQTNDYSRLNKALELIKQTQSEINRTSSIAGNGFSKTASSAKSATFAVTNFSRVIQDAPFGVIGFANNIVPLVESLQSLSAQAKITGESVGKQLLNSLKGGGGLILAFSAITTVLQFATLGFSAFTRGLSDGGKSIDETKKRVDELSKSLKDLEQAGKDAQSELDFQSQLEKLNAETRGIGDLTFLRGESLAQAERTRQLRENEKQAFNTLLQIREEGIKNNKLLDEDFIKSSDAAATSLRNIQESVLDSERKQRLIYAQIRRQKVKDQEEELKKQKELLEKQRDNLEKLNNEIIARAKAFAKEFGETFVVPNLEESFTNTKDKILAASKKLLEEVSKGGLKIKIPVQAEFEFLPEAQTTISNEQLERVQKLFQETFGGKNAELTIDASLATGNIKAIDQLAESFAKLGERGREAFAKINFSGNIQEAIKGGAEQLKLLQEQLSITAQFANIVGESFVQIFDAIKAGENPIKAFFDFFINELTRLIAKLIATKIAAAFLNAVFPGAGSAAGSILPGIDGFRPQVNSGFGGVGGIIGQSFQSNLVVQVVGRVSGDSINLAGGRALNSSGR